MPSHHDRHMVGRPRYERQARDLYLSDHWMTHALLAHWRPRGALWECAAGRGDISRVLKTFGHRVVSTDLEPYQEGRVVDVAGGVDFLAAAEMPAVGGEPVTGICTNPPFDSEDGATAEAFLRHALDLTERRGGQVAFLLRNEFDCAGGRADLFTSRAFCLQVVMTKRPRWDWWPGFPARKASKGSSPRHAYSWFIFDWRNRSAPIKRYFGPGVPGSGGQSGA